MDSSLIWIEQFTFFAAFFAVALLAVWLSRALFWIRNRLAKKFHFSKVEMTFLLMAPVVMFVLWRVYAYGPME